MKIHLKIVRLTLQQKKSQLFPGKKWQKVDNILRGAPKGVPQNI